LGEKALTIGERVRCRWGTKTRRGKRTLKQGGTIVFGEGVPKREKRLRARGPIGGGGEVRKNEGKCPRKPPTEKWSQKKKKRRGT